MTPWKLPPKEKIFEAFSVLADNRYEILNKNAAKVTSSAGDKQYSVKWNESVNGILISSNDNASHWQGYTGYPIIALLMILDKIKFDRSILSWFKDIPWNTLNKSHKNDYAKVVEIILSKIDTENRNNIRKAADSVFKQLASLNLNKLSG